jgi:hypothetical protein
MPLLMEHVRSHYLAGHASPALPADHSELHLVELLVTYAARDPAGDLAPVRDRFLRVEVEQRDFAADAVNAIVSHQVESLGRLLAAPGLAWPAGDRARVREWLSELEAGRFRDPSQLDLDSLSHLAWGLRAIAAHRAALQGD